MNQRTTITYRTDGSTIREKLLTLAEFIQFSRLKPGQRILLGEVNNEGYSYNTQSLWIGDATIYNGPTTASDEGWDWNSTLCKKYVIEVNEYT